MLDVDRQYLSGVMKQALGREAPDLDVVPLPGDASNRRYFRLVTRNGPRPHKRPAASCVLMKLADPEAFKQFEEKVSRSTIPITELPFINILHHLEACHVHVPRLLYYDRPQGLVFLEDLGDRLFEDAVRAKTRAVQARLYRAAINELVQLQVVGTSRQSPTCIAFGRAFDVPLLMWEFDHFLEYGIEVRGGCRVAASDRQRIREAFQAIAETISKEPRCLTHRDYHSRNLIIRRGRVWVLDFQDALMGPCQYDLASLLRDSYHTLPDDLVEDMIHYYVDEKARREDHGARPRGLAAFRRIFDLVSIQRNLKAAGRFVYIHAVKKNDGYLRYVAPTLAYVKRTLERYDDLKALRTLLRPYVPELN